MSCQAIRSSIRCGTRSTPIVLAIFLYKHLTNMLKHQYLPYVLYTYTFNVYGTVSPTKNLDDFMLNRKSDVFLYEKCSNSTWNSSYFSVWVNGSGFCCTMTNIDADNNLPVGPQKRSDQQHIFISVWFIGARCSKVSVSQIKVWLDTRIKVKGHPM